MGFEVEDGGMESTSTLFEKVVPVRVTKCNSEDRHMDLTARFVMGLSKGFEFDIPRAQEFREKFRSSLS